MSWLSGVVDHIVELHGAAAYSLVGACAFVQCAVPFGFILPGVLAVLTGGVLAYLGAVSLTLMAVVAAVGAVVGNGVGYELGRRLGPRLLGGRLARRHQHRVDRARHLIVTRGGPAVFLSRFTAVLRALTPSIAGSVGMPYRRFLVWSTAGGVVWAVGTVLLGWLAGRQYRRVAGLWNTVGIWAVVAIVVVGAAVWIPRNRHRLRRRGAGGPAVPRQEPDPRP